MSTGRDLDDADAAQAPARGGSLRRDLATTYAAAAARVGSWAAVSALVFRADPAAFALLALVRATLGLLNYTTVGLAPAMVRMLAGASVPSPLYPGGRVRVRGSREDSDRSDSDAAPQEPLTPALSPEYGGE